MDYTLRESEAITLKRRLYLPSAPVGLASWTLGSCVLKSYFHRQTRHCERSAAIS